METRFLVSCFIIRPAGPSHEVLQLRRAPGDYLGGAWALVAGGLEPGETAIQAILRELREETGLSPIELFQIDAVNTFFMASLDAIIHSVMFCAIVDPAAVVRLNEEHTEFRWTARPKVRESLLWPGERIGWDELCREILDDGPAKKHMRLASPADDSW